MGRNAVKTEDFVFRDSSGGHGPGTGGQLVVTDHAGNHLVVCWNDSFHEVILEAYRAGFFKGEKKGAEDARRDIRRALGIPHGEGR